QNRARQLLTEAGYPNGFRLLGGLSFSQAENPAIMQSIQDFHRQIGVQYDLNPLEPATYVQMALGVRPRTELISAGGSNANGIFSFSWQFFRCDQPPAAVLWCSPRMDQILTQAYGEPDLNRRNQLLREASRVLAEEQALVFLVTTPNFVIVGPKMRDFQRLTPSYYTFDSIFRSE
ncbi:MAG: hypothetical protein NZ518_02525, partial [Dehalococcoidia bacterium]|nr:hypothetical protein [Dehalococcoidia bacterium]